MISLQSFYSLDVMKKFEILHMLIPQEETLIIIKEYKKKCNCNKEYSWNHIVHMRLTEKSQF